MSEHQDRVLAHYDSRWADGRRRNLDPVGPAFRLAEFPPGFRILAFPPRADRGMWTYATCGMSTELDPQPLEIHLFSPVEAAELVELLCMVANYHRTGAALGHRHIVNFGRPWLPDSLCTRGLLSLPYLDGPKLEWLDGDPQIRFLWLIPITDAERQFANANGLGALEDRFEAAQFDYLDPARPSVV